MSVLSQFDYLRSLPTLEEVLSSCRVQRPLRAPCRALFCSCLVAAGAWVFEGTRLNRAAQSQEANANRYAGQLSSLRAERIHEKRVRLLTDLDRRVRAIAESGTLAARRLSALADDTRQHVDDMRGGEGVARFKGKTLAAKAIDYG